MRETELNEDEVRELNKVFQRRNISNELLPETARNIFVKSGLSEKELAGIWDVVTADSEGVLGYNQFLHAMTLIMRRRSHDAVNCSPTDSSETSWNNGKVENRAEAESLKRLQLMMTTLKMADDNAREVEINSIRLDYLQNSILSLQTQIHETEIELTDSGESEAKNHTNISESLHIENNARSKLEKLLKKKVSIKETVTFKKELIIQKRTSRDSLIEYLICLKHKLSNFKEERIRAEQKTSGSCLRSSRGFKQDEKGVRHVSNSISLQHHWEVFSSPV